MVEPRNVSVVIPVFNGEQTIKRALDSVFAQTFSDFEIIVVDDASSDRTIELVEQYDSDRLTIIRSVENRGAGAARNRGIAAARGRWVAFLDADDAWRPDKLARQIELLEQSGQSAAACATGYKIDKNGRRFIINLNLTPEDFRKAIIFGCTISPGSTLLLERYVFDEVGGFDEAFRRLEDWDWLLRFSERYNMQFLPDPLADIFLTQNKSSNDHDTTERILDGIRRMRKKHSSRLASLHKRLQFKSSLLIEHAALLHRTGRPMAAMLYVIAALGTYPARNMGFFRSLWRAASERIKR